MTDIKLNATSSPRLTSLSHGGGCGCKIAPGVLADLLKRSVPLPFFPDLLVGNDTADDAAVYRLNDEQAIVATTDFFMPIVDDPFDFGRIAATNALSDVYAMGGKPILALALVGMPINVLPHEVIAAVLTGGHSMDSFEPIYGLAAIGIVHPKRVKRNASARPGDVLILGKPLGVGVLSAALKKDQLDAAGYAAMIAATTKLNRPGADLAALDAVHALTDVTGFGLLGHTLELSRGARLTARLRYADLPWLPGVKAFAKAGVVTGASGRNWTAYGHDITLASSLHDVARSLLTDPQTSGGLLVSCAPEAVDEVLAIFRADGFDQAAVIGEMIDGESRVEVI
jgi:selenide, water dikinase